MADYTAIERLEVHKGSALAGTLARTARGAEFVYDPAYRSAHSAADRRAWVSFHLPLARASIECSGTNVHPFFAGLLPEGLRLRALRHAVKTSEDDLFTMLAAVGGDLVGDVSVRRESEGPIASGPSVSLANVSFRELFQEQLTTGGLTEPVVAGVQEKLSSSMISFPVSFGGRRSRYILKLEPPEQPRILHNERLCMELARKCGISTPKVMLVRDGEGVEGLLVERFDRYYDKHSKRMVGIHQEDACQFLNVYPSEKYRLGCARIAQGIVEWCSAPVVEIAKLLRLIAFSYLIANGNLHAKNVSIGYDRVTGLVRLTPAYDLLSTLPYGDQQMALEFEGRKDNFKRRDFVAFGERCGVREAVVHETLNELLDLSSGWGARVEEIGFEQRRERQLARELGKRREDLR